MWSMKKYFDSYAIFYPQGFSFFDLGLLNICVECPGMIMKWGH